MKDKFHHKKCNCQFIRNIIPGLLFNDLTNGLVFLTGDPIVSCPGTSHMGLCLLDNNIYGICYTIKLGYFVFTLNHASHCRALGAVQVLQYHFGEGGPSQSITELKVSRSVWGCINAFKNIMRCQMKAISLCV